METNNTAFDSYLTGRISGASIGELLLNEGMFSDIGVKIHEMVGYTRTAAAMIRMLPDIKTKEDFLRFMETRSGVMKGLFGKMVAKIDPFSAGKTFEPPPPPFTAPPKAVEPSAPPKPKAPPPPPRPDQVAAPETTIPLPPPEPPKMEPAALPPPNLDRETIERNVVDESNRMLDGLKTMYWDFKNIFENFPLMWEDFKHAFSVFVNIMLKGVELSVLGAFVYMLGFKAVAILAVAMVMECLLYAVVIKYTKHSDITFGEAFKQAFESMVEQVKKFVRAPRAEEPFILIMFTVFTTTIFLIKGLLAASVISFASMGLIGLYGMLAVIAAIWGLYLIVGMTDRVVGQERPAR